ncbi:hypothetical protein [Streptomyces candidus]|uniref:Uncharacterized protein n=1 Tax=Streptomyces candidus TaxID=67283 RepID=A0A7X0LTD9_9ACTN|nr:hypothetical protein [Streptomyces candidus]MBB6440172.1 hypothetical protein [Streptomyces candidus]GHH57641.1 hypothetical protein GCM10018773_65220 [Streptomyces candidus]
MTDDLAGAARDAATAAATVRDGSSGGWDYDAYHAAWSAAEDLVAVLGTLDATAEQLLAPARAALVNVYDHVDREGGPFDTDD